RRAGGDPRRAVDHQGRAASRTSREPVIAGGAAGRGDALWLTGLCASRFLIGLVFTSYAAVLPVLQKEWGMSATAAGAVSSAFQLGYAASLVGCNLLSGRIGARPVFLWSTVAGAPAAMAFALVSHGPWSAALLYGLTALLIGGNYTPGLILIAERFPAATWAGPRASSWPPPPSGMPPPCS